MTRHSWLLLNAPSSRGIFLKEGRCESRAVGQLTPPLTMAVVAALIRERGITPVLRDYMVTPFDSAWLERQAQEAEMALLVVSTPTFSDDAALAARLRRACPSLPILAWGTLATALPDLALREAPALDGVIVGEPEEAVRALLDGAEWGRVPGLVWRDESGLHRGEAARPVENLDTLPRAARDLLEWRRYIEPSRGEPFTAIQVSRGCPMGCAFCTVRAYHGSKVRKRSPASIVSEIRECRDRFGTRSFLFLADHFTHDPAWVFALCDEIRAARLDIRWFCNSRVDAFDPRLAYAMKAAGCWLVSFGAESAAADVQRNVGKRLSRHAMMAAAHACREAGLRSYFYWMFGLPGETRRSVWETFRTACEVNADFAAFSFAVPFPGTRLYEEAERNGRLRHHDWARYEMSDSDALILDSLSYDELRRAVSMANLAYYLRLRYLSSLPRRFSVDELMSLSRSGARVLGSWLPGVGKERR